MALNFALLKTSFIVQVLYQPTIQLARISILLFYLNSLGKQARPVCLGLIDISILFAIVCTVVEFLQCKLHLFFPSFFLWLTPQGPFAFCDLGTNQLLL